MTDQWTTVRRFVGMLFGVAMLGAGSGLAAQKSPPDSGPNAVEELNETPAVPEPDWTSPAVGALSRDAVGAEALIAEAAGDPNHLELIAPATADRDESSASFRAPTAVDSPAGEFGWLRGPHWPPSGRLSPLKRPQLLQTPPDVLFEHPHLRRDRPSPFKTPHWTDSSSEGDDDNST